VKLSGQGKFAQRRRVSEGCCPVHGCGMAQSSPEETDDGNWVEWTECPRGDCDIRVGYKNGKFKEPASAVGYEI
jgi:hypothetical protein